MEIRKPFLNKKNLLRTALEDSPMIDIDEAMVDAELFGRKEIDVVNINASGDTQKW